MGKLFNRLVSLGTLFGALLLAGPVIASGGGSGNIVAPTGPMQERKVDERYEYGKAVYLGREPGTTKIPYCVLVDGEPKKLKRRTLKPYRKGSVVDFANALYHCDDPSKLALLSLAKDQVPHVLYYLNKRYRLKLSDA